MGGSGMLTHSVSGRFGWGWAKCGQGPCGRTLSVGASRAARQRTPAWIGAFVAAVGRRGATTNG